MVIHLYYCIIKKNIKLNTFNILRLVKNEYKIKYTSFWSFFQKTILHIFSKYILI